MRTRQLNADIQEAVFEALFPQGDSYVEDGDEMADEWDAVVFLAGVDAMYWAVENALDEEAYVALLAPLGSCNLQAYLREYFECKGNI